MSQSVYCTGDITLVEAAIRLDGVGQWVAGQPYCADGWLATPFTLSVGVAEIDPGVLAAYFGAGFGLFALPWLTAWAFGVGLRALRFL